MLKLFRIFRIKNSEDQTSKKYLFYGIGEILLIVFGILIALQIDNWNENRKDRIFEKSVLQDIRSSLQEDVNQLEDAKVRSEDMLKSINKLLTIPAYSDSLSLDFLFALWFGLSFEARTSAFENLRNRGFQIIAKEDLRKKIISHFDFDYKRQLYLWEREINTDRENRHNFVRTHFNFYEIRGRSRILPKDYQDLIRNPDFKNVLLERKSHVERVKRVRIENLIKKNKEMINDIDIVLNK